MISESKFRVFIALKIDQKVTQLANDVIRHLKAAYQERFRAVKPSGFHITLLYLGDIEDGLILSVNKEVSDICDLTPPIKFAVNGFGVFPTWSRPNVLWLRIIDPKSELGTLRRNIVEAVSGLDFPKVDSVFRPHITLGRFKRKLKSADTHELKRISALLKQREPLRCTTINLFVMESTPTSRGVLYKPISEFSLDG